FAEPDAYGRQQKRDPEDFAYVHSIVYSKEDELPALLAMARTCDLVIKHSGIGVFDSLLEEKVLQCASADTPLAFWVVAPPASLARVEPTPEDPLLCLVPE